MMQGAPMTPGAPPMTPGAPMMQGAPMTPGAPMMPIYAQLSVRTLRSDAAGAHRTTGRKLRGLQPEAEAEDNLSNEDAQTACPCNCEGQSLPVYSDIGES